MNKLVQGIAVKLIEKNFLDINRKDEYIYVIETSLEKFLSYTFILAIAVLTGSLLQSIIFLVLFINIRGKTGGFHMNTYVKCLVSTIVLYLLLSSVVIPVLFNYYTASYFIFCYSILCIIFIATINHPNMNMSEREFKEKKKVARLEVFIHWQFISVLYITLPRNDYILYAMSADILCAILMIVAKIKKQEVV